MDMFFALADPTRRSIVELLARRGQLSASDISNKFQTSPSAISQHLKILRQSGLIDMEKRAQQRIYQINPRAVSELETWVQRLRQQWEERFEALDALLEQEKLRADKESR